MCKPAVVLLCSKCLLAVAAASAFIWQIMKNNLIKQTKGGSRGSGDNKRVSQVNSTCTCKEPKKKNQIGKLRQSQLRPLVKCKLMAGRG